MVAAIEPLTAPKRIGTQHFVILGLILAAALALRIVFFVGLICTDDMATWQLSKTLADGELAPEHVLQNDISTRRYGPAFPTALFFKLFGISEATVMLYPILAALLGVLVLWDLTRRLTGSLGAAHFAAALLAASALDIHYSTVALPDGPMAAVSLLVLWCIVVAYDPDRRTTFSGWLLLFVSGFLLTFAFAHKEAAVQVIAAVGAWGVLLLVMKRFRPALWMIPLGCLAALALEHLLFWAAYGDPFNRWKTIIDTLHAGAYTDLDAQERFELTLRRMYETMPASTILALIGLPLGIVAMFLHRRSVGILLVAMYVMVSALTRLVEATQTYCYQPRRWLPLIGGTALLLGLLLYHGRRHRWLAVTLSLVLLGPYVYYSLDRDIEVVVRAGEGAVIERIVHQWTQDNAGLIRERGLHTDVRTCKVLYVLGGLQPLAERGIYATDFCAPALGSCPLDRPTEGAFYFESARWATRNPLSYEPDPNALSRPPVIPRAWELAAVFEYPGRPWLNAALYKIHDAGAADAALETVVHRSTWQTEPDGAALPAERFEHNPDGTLAFELTAGETMRLFGGDARLVTRADAASPDAPDYLRVTVPMRAEANAAAPEALFGLLGWEIEGSAIERRVLPAEVGSTWQRCTTYLPVTGLEIDAIKPFAELVGAGRYEIEPAELSAVSAAEVQLDFGFGGRHQPERGWYYGWHVKDVSEADLSLTRDEVSGEARVAIDVPFGSRARMTKWNPTAAADKETPLARRGECLAVWLPVENTRPNQAGPAASVGVQLIGRTRDGDNVRLGRRTQRIDSDNREIRAYALLDEDIMRLFVTIDFNDGGHFLVSAPRLRHYPRLRFATRNSPATNRAPTSPATIGLAPSPPRSSVLGDIPPVLFDQPLETYESYWTRGMDHMRITPEQVRLGFTAQAIAETDEPIYAGVRIPVSGCSAARLCLSIENPEGMRGIYIDGYDARGRRTVRWQWLLSPWNLPLPGTTVYDLFPGQSSGYFLPAVNEHASATTEVHVFAQVNPGTTCGLEIHEARFENASHASMRHCSESDLTFDGVVLAGPDDAFVSPKWSTAPEVHTRRIDDGLRCDVAAGPKGPTGQYGGIRIDAPELAALQLDITLLDPENIQHLYIDGYSAEGDRVVRWQWRSPTADDVDRQTWCLLPGAPAGPFQAVEWAGGETPDAEGNVGARDPIAPIAVIDIFIYAAVESESGFVVHDLAVGRRVD